MAGVTSLFDKVVLIDDVPEANLPRAMVGSVDEIYNGGAAYEVEFIDPGGHTYALETIGADRLLKLLYEPIR